jgi:uncharacterized protein YbjT (DUF2867 family)
MKEDFTMNDGISSPASGKTFAVVGSTGQQGGAAARALLAAGANVRALVRDLDSVASQALRELGAELVQADLNDGETLVAAFTRVDGAFAMTTNWGNNGTVTEVRHGKAIADAAAKAGLPQLVYSSVGGAERHTGIPHFESKRVIEEYLQERLDVRFVRPTFFMDNLSGVAGSDDDEIVFRFPLAADTPLQMIAVDDIGTVAAAILRDPSRIAGDSIEIAGDELTAPQIAALIGEHLNRPARFESLPLAALGDDHERKSMFTWFQAAPSYRADFEATKKIDPGVRTFADWLANRG